MEQQLENQNRKNHKQEVLDSEYFEVRESGIHNKGAFAKKDIPKDTEIVEYVGEKITKAESEKRATKYLNKAKRDKNFGQVYIFSLNKKYDIDGNVPWNPSKYINHSCDPNCEYQSEDDKKIWVVAIKDIKKGEELTVNYGYDVDNWEEHPCKCGSKKCVGYIVEEEQWPKLRKLIEKKKKENSE